ncbi:hypothetical protein ZIOFF_010381 [Zingiber officinale]|uniref:Uncharacterized protein n=1 Tax=Zingiber officinale TaxID=94328 RepID=A0A8J5LPB3_ZINOF|nr:hypothetical protein ZIOFF_010381 [Zingiber officinale]
MPSGQMPNETLVISFGHCSIQSTPWNNSFAADREQQQKRKREGEAEMILVAMMAAVLEEYTAAAAGVMEEALLRVPIPRRVCILILRCLPFAGPPPLPPPPPYSIGRAAPLAAGAR